MGFGLASGLAGRLIVGPVYGLVGGLGVGLVLGLGVALEYGGNAVIKHIILRIILTQSGL